MATIVPFRALRPSTQSAAAVAAVPYDVVGVEEARTLAQGNPLSFLHVSRAEIDLPPATDPHSEVVYAQAASNFARLIATAPLVTEDTPSLYLYRLRSDSHEQTGVAACYSLEEYTRDVIRKHERTRRDKEDDRTRHMLALRAQTGPVFLTYRATASVDEVAQRASEGSPVFDFTAADGVQHTIWRLGSNDAAALVRTFEDIPALYIADGHHRAASAARARDRLRANDGACECDTFLAVAFPDTQMQILPYNRVVKDLGSHSPESLLEALRARFAVRALGPSNRSAREPQRGDASGAIPTSRGEVRMYLAGGWYSLALGPPPSEAGAAGRLDVSRLQKEVLAPILGIGDVTTDRRIDFVGGARGPSELEKRVDSGKAAVAFSMYPVTVGDLMEISDAGGIMPPKSTWFEPKLRDGLLIHVI